MYPETLNHKLQTMYCTLPAEVHDEEHYYLERPPTDTNILSRYSNLELQLVIYHETDAVVWCRLITV